MEKLILQISAGRGPAECCLVVTNVLRLILNESLSSNIKTEILEQIKGPEKPTLLSATLMLDGNDLEAFVSKWEGTLQWIAQSPYRPKHKRKNWFVGIAAFDVAKQLDWNEQDIRFETCRSSGPGGQHVNKVETAVRGIHMPSGIQVLAMESRSQLQNKKQCTERLRAKVLSLQAEQLLQKQQERWQEHNVLQRGNAIKVIKAALL